MLEFSQEELDKFSKDYIELAIEALDDGDVKGARTYLIRQNEIKNMLHDNYTLWVARLLTHIYNEWGEDAAVTALHKTVEGHRELGRRRAEVVAAGGVRAWLEEMIEAWRVHGSHPGLTVEEDEEKFILKLQPCGSGGKLIDAGYFDGDNSEFARLKKAGPHTWGETDIPIYCAHCVQVHEIMPIEENGQGGQLWVHEGPFPKNKGDPCIHHYYKRSADMPEKYYERLGMTKNVDKPERP